MTYIVTLKLMWQIVLAVESRNVSAWGC